MYRHWKEICVGGVRASQTKLLPSSPRLKMLPAGSSEKLVNNKPHDLIPRRSVILKFVSCADLKIHNSNGCPAGKDISRLEQRTAIPL
jgi:hypothetical protein